MYYEQYKNRKQSRSQSIKYAMQCRRVCPWLGRLTLSRAPSRAEMPCQASDRRNASSLRESEPQISSLCPSQAGSIHSLTTLSSPPPPCRPLALLSSAHLAQGHCAQQSSPTPSDPSAPPSQKAPTPSHLHTTSRDGNRHPRR